MKRSFKPLYWGLAVACTLVLAFSAVGTMVAPDVRAYLDQRLDPERWALKQYLARSQQPGIREAYAGRAYRPVWLTDGRASVEALQLIARMEASAPDGLNPTAYRFSAGIVDADRLPTASAAARAAFDVELTIQFAHFVSDLHRPSGGAELHYTDPALRPFRPSPAQAVAAVTKAAFLRTAVINATRMNTFYYEYRDALSAALNASSIDQALVQDIRINMERVRALPVDMGARFVFVDIRDQRLWVYDNGVAVDSMKVIVGTPQDPTPSMAALIRYTVFNPFWNIPPDLSQRHYASIIAPEPAVALERLQIDAWSDFSENAHRLEPTEVNWAAAANGRIPVWLRQRPGPSNAMGAAKFMFPNEFGVYLHDTPHRDLFVQEARGFSAGCVRVEDYRRLSKWLFRGRYPDTRAVNFKADLPQPVPVYLLYLTAVPKGGGVERREDIYVKDPSILAGMGGAIRASETKTSP